MESDVPVSAGIAAPAAAAAPVPVAGLAPEPKRHWPGAVLASGVLAAGAVTGRAPTALQRLLSAPTAVRIGRRSYGLYLWQYLLLAVTQALCAPHPGISLSGPWQGRMILATAMAAGVAASFILAEVSYQRVELPALRLKRRFRWAPPSAAPS